MCFIHRRQRLFGVFLQQYFEMKGQEAVGLLQRLTGRAVTIDRARINSLQAAPTCQVPSLWEPSCGGGHRSAFYIGIIGPIQFEDN